jgi:hypothetical protein
MKPHLNLIWGMAGLAAIVTVPMLRAAETPGTYPLNEASSHPAVDYSKSTSLAASASNAVVVALNAQTSLLKELLQEHQGRAVELTQKNENEKARWETDLVNELQEKTVRLQKSIGQMSQSEAVEKALKSPGGNIDDELIFVSTIEAHLEQIHQELLAAIEDSRLLSTQIATNKTSEDFGVMSAALGDNQKLVKDLQKEQLDFELRKLEFRAIRKAMQK